ncbi:family 78 glycoside hydrolase catalytic domain [Sphingobacterium sp. LRF_L2]|uniref:alpha-L-rhamnosidase n=1 Tax=Sphingobacterium sp. LRF_L2 TaxID=3369421 RepID=UPI003F614C0C
MRSWSIFLVLFLTVVSGHIVANPIAADLRCELLSNPLAIDVLQPRLGWKIGTSERNVMQQAYHVIVASSMENMNNDIGDLWDSGKTVSSNSTNVIYQGKGLASRAKVYWKVKVFTNAGTSDWSTPATWTMGLLYYKDWTGRWIGFDQYFENDDEATGQLAARYFRKEFTVQKKVKQATAYMMGLGLYELQINGQKIGEQVLAPVPTDYTKNIQYNVFDVTAALKKGQQALGIILGNGRFYAMRQAKPYKVKTFGFPKVQFQLMITYEDGTSEIIKTDDSWKGTADGPITANNEYDGEIYDARKELIGWSTVGYEDGSWQRAAYVQEPGGTYEAQRIGGMKVMQDIQPVSIVKKEDGKYLIDYGQNFSGWVKMRVKGKPGQQVTLRFAESLDENGNLFTTNLRDAKATDIYIIGSDQQEEWEPRFTYHGFRYLEVEGYADVALKENFIGRFVYDDIPTIGRFSSSNTLLNQIHQNAWWGIASNYKGIPVDCPQRNERQPWLGDRPTSAYGESFLFDNVNFYNKWLEDIRLSQKEDGAIPDVAPAFWRYYSDNISWPGTYVMIVDMLYQQSADTRVVAKHYEAMKKWMDYMRIRYSNEKGIITKDSYGDWCFPPVTIEEGRGKIADKKYPSALISSAYYYHLLNLMTKFSGLLGNAADSVRFEEVAKQLKQDFNRTFYNGDGNYGTKSLTDNLLPMYFGLVEEHEKTKLANRIVEIIEKENKGHLSTGVVGTQWIMRTLTNMGRADLAYRLATNTTYPSWGYMVENGATTIWELWNGNTAHPKMNSQNHVMMLGDLLIWYYEHLAGIKSAENGFQTIEMKPEFITGLQHVDATYTSLYGEIGSNWRKSKNVTEWIIRIPANTKASVFMPVSDVKAITENGKALLPNNTIQIDRDDKGNVLLVIGSGEYHFKIKR